MGVDNVNVTSIFFMEKQEIDVKLAEHLSLRTPVIWVTTEEPGRVIDKVIEEAGRPVFRLDTLSGLITWNTERNTWVKVLMTDPDGEYYACKDPQESFEHVLQKRGIMIVENAHSAVEMMAGFFLSVILEYRKAFYQDNSEITPAQFVLLSHEDTIPGEISRMTTHLAHELPSLEDLEEILAHLTLRIPSEDESNIISRAGLGLSETEFISAAMLSKKETGSIKAEVVNHAKMELLKKNGILEVRTPDINVDDLGGLDNAKKLIEQVNWVWNAPEEAAELGIDSLRRIMFVGVPGTGKSLICEAISSSLRLDLAKGGVSNAMNKFVGESEANMRRMFSSLKRMAPIVFWIDEFGRDMSGGMSSGAVDGGTTDRVHGEFLTGLQELPDNVFLAAAANRIEDLPPEMTRADRFDRIMFVGFPTLSEREDIFRIHLGDKQELYNITQLAAATPYFTGAEIKALIREVRFDIGTVERRQPKTEEFISHIPRVKGRVWINHRDPIVAMYERARVEWSWASSEQLEEAEEVLRDARMPIAAPKIKPTPHPKSAAKYTPQEKKAQKPSTFQVPKQWGK